MQSLMPCSRKSSLGELCFWKIGKFCLSQTEFTGGASPNLGLRRKRESVSGQFPREISGAEAASERFGTTVSRFITASPGLGIGGVIGVS